jgi:methylenetetrahydrofolate dehydrogenase (NADP+)/methenyltetrahydrofolate cyclohydrolase/formyltetrahydrofolate synthetase
LVRSYALSAGADAAAVSNHWAKGGEGARPLAEAVVATCEGESNFKFLYDLDTTIDAKIESIAKNIYGADGIELSELARKQVDTYTRQGYGRLPSSFFLCA